MSIGVRLKPRASEASIRAMVEAAGGVYEPPRKKRKFDPGPEHKFQVAIKKYLDLAIGPPGVLSPDGVFWMSIDTPHNTPRVNASTGKKYDLEGQMRKARGCVRSVPDMEFQWGDQPFQRGKIELKARHEPVPDDQLQHLHVMTKFGWYGKIIWDHEGVQRVEEVLRAWGCPLRATVSA